MQCELREDEDESVALSSFPSRWRRCCNFYFKLKHLPMQRLILATVKLSVKSLQSKGQLGSRPWPWEIITTVLTVATASCLPNSHLIVHLKKHINTNCTGWFFCIKNGNCTVIIQYLSLFCIVSTFLFVLVSTCLLSRRKQGELSTPTLLLCAGRGWDFRSN